MILRLIIIMIHCVLIQIINQLKNKINIHQCFQDHNRSKSTKTTETPVIHCQMGGRLSFMVEMLTLQQIHHTINIEIVKYI